MSSNCNPFLDPQEQICYVQCGFCTTILLVSVPCSDILKVVTVKCGHCTELLTVNLKRATFIPLHLLAPLEDNAVEAHELISHEEVPELPKGLSQTKSPAVESAENNEEDTILPNNQIYNKRDEFIKLP
ncbi:hypothetical protein Scep_017836 [Stephania cephalantha]|uniref:YABBY N-terminal domain-containing protein n=1 Tax=Stephania cephalantha TaxID=152367 RepID=A0AAP0IQ92_9MAGN